MNRVNQIFHLLIFLSILLIYSGGFKAALAQDERGEKVVLAIHGGAGAMERGSMSAEREQAYRTKLEEALKTGYAVLQQNGSSLDAVEAAIQVLEESPLFNAGRGAVLTNEGTAELDASIMDGKTLTAGAVAGVKRVKSPIQLARMVMERSPHVMFAGEGAEVFAREQGLELVPNEYFRTEERVKQLQRMKESGAARFESEPFEKYGTVGAVALDEAGNLAAGTSTGGMMNKRFGRIGDSPIVGAGTYADNTTCAVSSTGHGEYFIRGVVAYRISALMQYGGLSLAESAAAVIHGTLTEMGGTGGVIALDREGNVAMPFNTTGMFRGYITESGETKVLIYRD